MDRKRENASLRFARIGLQRKRFQKPLSNSSDSALIENYNHFRSFYMLELFEHFEK